MSRSPVIIALDVPSAVEARKITSALGDEAGFYKVGLELYAAAGMDFVRELKSEGNRVFLDLKLYDIGEQVKRAVAVISAGGADFLTVHAVNQVMLAAAETRGSLELLAVTVLTSFDEKDVRDDGSALSIYELVEKRVGNAVAAGMNGIVCSSLEVAKVRAIAGPKMKLVIPGVRSPGKSAADQKRIATPAEAMAAGADYIVVGRQVTRSADPRSELKKILDEIHAYK